MGCKTIENPLGTETTIWNKHNTDKNPNWPEAKQLAVYKHGQEEEQGSTGTNPAINIRAGVELMASRLQLQCSNHSATLLAFS